MKNDLTDFEKNLLRTLNFLNSTNYNHNHLMEWSSSGDVVEKNLQEGEKMYEVQGFYVSVKSGD